MLYRAVLLLAALETVFGGGAVAERHLMFRQEEHDEYEAKRLGEASTVKGHVCGKDVTPDFIQGCVYTDCFRSDAGANSASVPHAGLTRRRMAGYTGPFPNLKGIKQSMLCPINPTAAGPGRAHAQDFANSAARKAKGCPAGDERAAKPILDDYSGVKGTVVTGVCSYTSPTPTATGLLTGTDNWGVTGTSSAPVKCQCRTIRCKVITKDDTTVKENGDKQMDGQTACNFIVRIEDTHAVPSVPNWIMWVIFGLALVVATVTSAFFICLYGSKAHSPEGGGSEEGDNE